MSQEMPSDLRFLSDSVPIIGYSIRYAGVINQDGPGGLLRQQPTEFPGPRPTLDRSAEL